MNTAPCQQHEQAAQPYEQAARWATEKFTAWLLAMFAGDESAARLYNEWQTAERAVKSAEQATEWVGINAVNDNGQLIFYAPDRRIIGWCEQHGERQWLIQIQADTEIVHTTSLLGDSVAANAMTHDLVKCSYRVGMRYATQ